VRRIVELRPWERLALDRHGSWLTVISEQSPMCHDSAFLVSVAGCSVLNCNDARLTAAQVRRATVVAGGRLDLMTVQTSGASWHPICYEYPTEVVRSIEERKRLSKFRAVVALVRAASPRLAVPSAGPPCFLDPELQRHNDSIPAPGIFPDQEQAAGWLARILPEQRIAAFRPGDVVDLASGAVETDEVSAAMRYDDLGGYLAAYAADRRAALATVYAQHPEPGPGLDGLFAEHFTRLGGLSPWFLRRIGLTLRFEVTGPNGGRWDVAMGDGGLEVDLRGRARRPNYRLRVAGRWLLPVLTGEQAWEDLLLSLRISACRDPDVYNDYLVGLLKHANRPALRAVEEYETRRDPGERVLVNAGGATYEIDRYCPHAGEDLTEGAVTEGGVLRCLAHNFEFDLATGACRNARCAPLNTALVLDDRAPIDSAR
jgi:UDP-MurNAc hydroxylase